MARRFRLERVSRGDGDLSERKNRRWRGKKRFGNRLVDEGSRWTSAIRGNGLGIDGSMDRLFSIFRRVGFAGEKSGGRGRPPRRRAYLPGRSLAFPFGFDFLSNPRRAYSQLVRPLQAAPMETGLTGFNGASRARVDAGRTRALCVHARVCREEESSPSRT